MKTASRFGLGCLLLLPLLAMLRQPGLAREEQPTVLRLGLVNTLFRDTPRASIWILARPIKVLLETQTGMTGQLEGSADPHALSKQLQDNQLDIAVFHGFEFAWARMKYPDLQPLLIVRNPQRFQAFLVVPNNSKYNVCADLKGSTLAVPLGSRGHVHLFLQRRCIGDCKEPKEFFAKISQPTDAEDALDDVAVGYAHAAVVDFAQLEAYRKAKPDSYEKLRVLLKSEIFPTGVIAYRSGALSDEAVQHIRNGLISANQSKQGRELLRLCRMSGFDLAPDDFNETLASIAKLYPPLPPK